MVSAKVSATTSCCKQIHQQFGDEAVSWLQRLLQTRGRLSAETGCSNSGLKNRLAIAAKMIGMKPVTAATISRPELPITSDLKSP